MTIGELIDIIKDIDDYKKAIIQLNKDNYLNWDELNETREMIYQNKIKELRSLEVYYDIKKSK